MFSLLKNKIAGASAVFLFGVGLAAQAGPGPGPGGGRPMVRPQVPVRPISVNRPPVVVRPPIGRPPVFHPPIVRPPVVRPPVVVHPPVHLPPKPFPPRPFPPGHFPPKPFPPKPFPPHPGGGHWPPSGGHWPTPPWHWPPGHYCPFPGGHWPVRWPQWLPPEIVVNPPAVVTLPEWGTEPTQGAAYRLTCYPVNDQAQELNGLDVTISSQADGSFQVQGTVGLVDEQNPQAGISALASGAFSSQEVNLQVGDAGTIYLLPQTDGAGNTVYQGDIDLYGRKDSGNLQCLVTQ